MSLDYQKIHSIVDAFYDKAKTDILIGFHFSHIKDFDSHIEHIALFWEHQLLGTLSKKPEQPFNVPDAHIKLKINIGQLNRWIVLFYETLEEHLEDQTQFDSWKNKVEFFKGVFERKFLVA